MELIRTHLLDIILILIVICITAYGHRRGIMRMVISIVSFAVSVSAAVFISNVTYEYIYFNAVQPAVISIIESETDSVIEEYDPNKHIESFLKDTLSPASDTDIKESDASADLTETDFRVKINSVFTEYCTRLTDSLTGVLPDEIIESTEKYLNDNSVTTDDKINFFKKGSTDVAELIERDILRSVLLRTLKNIIFAAAFFAVNLIFSIIARFAGILRGITEIREADAFFGGLLGLVYSLLTIAAMALLCNIFIKFTGNANSVINTDIISGTWLFKYAYAGTFEIISQLLK